MAGRPIEIPIAINADGVDKGAANVSDAFEEIVSNLDDVAASGDKALSQLEDSLSGVDKALGRTAKEADSAGDKLADSFDGAKSELKDVAKTADKSGKDVGEAYSDAAKKIDRDLTKALEDVEDKARNSGKSLGDSVKKGTDKAGEGMSELKDESASTAKEAAASFGSIEDSADALQEVLANAFVGFGPAGMAAGIVAAVGIGLAVSALQENADKINENKERMLDLAQTLKDKGGEFDMSDAIQAMDDYGFAIQDSKEWFEFFQQDAVSGFEKLRDNAKDAGLTIGEAFKGQFGELEDAKKVSEELTRKLKDLEIQTESNKIVSSDYGQTIDMTDEATKKQIAGTKELSDKVKDHIKELEAANEIERIRKEAIKGTVEATLEDIAALEKRNGTLQSGVTTELDYWDQVADTNKILEENGQTLDKNTQAGRDNQRALIDQSNAALEMARSQLDAGTSADQVALNLTNQREAILQQIDAITGSREASEKLAAAMGLIPKDIITEVKTNGVAETKTEIEKIPAKTDTTVEVSETGSAETQARINSVQGKEVKIDVDDDYTVSEVQKRIDGIRGRDLVKIDVDDDYTVKAVQDRIDGIKGRDVYVNLKVGNEFEFQQTIARLTQSATKTINIETRGGVPND
ncbi:hypothetical protein FV140_14625 [Paenarthrobacter ureafaciens]|uniref:Uncharacterized protein n=1 Tax=Paenarthrobacter ureafaciens TaxID=37931 RepID=A0AAX3EEI0_PAEUR|nr:MULTISPECIES: hypothetical protein [Paenarthrobacter]MDO5876497.1 hypothetical protein [Paenarthrobacter sp. SD-1]QMU83194.1 hypothetical protein FV140_14625 [Paenarthrobacter ureafaciens]UYV96271.1 hypothetical protein NL394_14505 [Paenarthrobacter ureafaciens]